MKFIGRPRRGPVLSSGGEEEVGGRRPAGQAAVDSPSSCLLLRGRFH